MRRQAAQNCKKNYWRDDLLAHDLQGTLIVTIRRCNKKMQGCIMIFFFLLLLLLLLTLHNGCYLTMPLSNQTEWFIYERHYGVTWALKPRSQRRRGREVLTYTSFSFFWLRTYTIPPPPQKRARVRAVLETATSRDVIESGWFKFEDKTNSNQLIFDWFSLIQVDEIFDQILVKPNQIKIGFIRFRF